MHNDTDYYNWYSQYSDTRLKAALTTVPASLKRLKAKLKTHLKQANPSSFITRSLQDKIALEIRKIADAKAEIKKRAALAPPVKKVKAHALKNKKPITVLADTGWYGLREVTVKPTITLAQAEKRAKALTNAIKDSKRSLSDDKQRKDAYFNPAIDPMAAVRFKKREAKIKDQETELKDFIKKVLTPMREQVKREKLRKAKAAKAKKPATKKK